VEDSTALPATFYEQAIQQVHRKLVEADSIDARSTGRSLWRRGRRIGFAMAALLVPMVVALSTLRARPSQQAQAAVPVAASSEPGVEPTGANVPGPTQEISLTAAVDSLSEALDNYRDIATSHQRGRVSCRVLDRAYALVGRARTRLDSSRQRIAGGLADADSIRVSMLAAEFTFVSQTYRRSGCQP
jgi:hypothetical protein